MSGREPAYELQDRWHEYMQAALAGNADEWLAANFPGASTKIVTRTWVERELVVTFADGNHLTQSLGREKEESKP